MIEDPDHEAVLASRDRHRVVVAPPGTGKTLLSVRLAGELLPQLGAHQRVLLLTFSNQARGQLEREARLRLAASQRGRVEITNYHKLFLRGVSAYRRALGLPAGFRIVPLAVRRSALRTGAPRALGYFNDALTERLAEWSFPEFRDSATPPAEVLDEMLAVVGTEQHAGRLVFDDLGALFWRLLAEFPAVDQAYRSRFPCVIADEHQDASGLQDALVRHLGTTNLTVLCDPMQLIHGYRGADESRLSKHLAEGVEFTLRTAHRWRNAPAAADWLLAVRGRLQGGTNPTSKIAECRVVRTPDTFGLNGTIRATIEAVRESEAAGCKSIAVLAPTRVEVAEIRKQMCVAGLRPRQVGASDDLDEAYELLERLRTVREAKELAEFALKQFAALVPAFPSGQLRQMAARLQPAGVNLVRATPEVARHLELLRPLYDVGVGAYLTTISALLSTAEASGYVLPRREFCELLHASARDPDRAEAIIQGELSAALMSRSTALAHGLFVMTTHQSKGREFDSVVLAHAIVRHYASTSTDKRNVFYVGVTRGMLRWYVIAPSSTMTGYVASLG